MAPYTCITVIYCCAAKRATFCFLKRDEGDDDHGLHIEADGAGTYIWLSDEQLETNSSERKTGRSATGTGEAD